MIWSDIQHYFLSIFNFVIIVYVECDSTPRRAKYFAQLGYCRFHNVVKAGRASYFTADFSDDSLAPGDTLGGLVQTGIGNGISQLVGHSLEKGNIFVSKSSAFHALNRQRPDDFVPADQREGHLRVGIW
jgi:hypothetical protein